MFANFLDKPLQKNATTGNGEAIEVQGVRLVTAYIIGSAGISAGAVQLEHSHDKGYTGTWAALGAATTVVANAVVAISFPPTALKAIRARISTAVVGGTVSVHVVAS
jgi:hypothetical protein